MDDLEVQDFGGLPYAVKVERVLELRRLLDLLETSGSRNWWPSTP